MYDFSHETHKESRFPSLHNQPHCPEYKIGHELFLSNLPRPEESEQRQSTGSSVAANHYGMRRSTAEPPSQRQFCAAVQSPGPESRLELGGGWHQGHRDEIAEQSIRQQVVRYSLQVREHSWVPVALSQMKKLSSTRRALSLFA